ncbi:MULTISPECIES: Gfo/Idh/MocA family oxidoreductase [unclassified Streptomyces]|uniref:Gfo/Idh/MocA family protein n=1 Tax=unclassified Streptomyces TaxID=2593676 RepID=UPI002E0D28E1|nr:Gfo/Idh/MocA family oxidoreductase [Streptomyces sp. NBC_01197]WSS48700.1 Gfo/Idh/MocA family oxidoreductase [Streptomyces sp. NBC_01180]
MTKPSRTKPTRTKARIGLLGTGPWARSTHAPALAAHPDIEFSGVWGRRREAAAELAAEHGTTAYDGVDALLAASDAVAVALPPDVQAPLATRAAAAGCHLLLDKPVATTVSGAREVVAAAARSGVASVVFCTLRFTPGVAEWIAGQAAVDGWFTGRAEWLGALFSPGVDSPYAASPWRGEKGGLWDVGPHALSVLLPVLGDATEVTAAGGAGDTVHLALRHTSGASSSATLSLSAPARAAGATVEFRGTHGVAVLPEGRGGAARVPFAAAVDALLAAVRTGEPHPCDVRFGLRLTEILAEAEKQLTGK